MASHNRHRASEPNDIVRRLVDEAHRDEARHRDAVAGERCPHGNVSASWTSCARCIEEQEGLDALAERRERENGPPSPGFRHTTTYGGTTRHRFDLGAGAAAPYFEVCEDGDTDWVTYFESGGARNEMLLAPFSIWTRAGLRATLAEHAVRVGWGEKVASEQLIAAILNCLPKTA